MILNNFLISIFLLTGLIIIIALMYVLIVRNVTPSRLPNLDSELYSEETFDADVSIEVLYEARRRFDNEIERRDSLENKLSIIFVLNGAIVALISSNPQSPSIVYFDIAAGLSIVSSGLGLLALRQHEYQRAGVENYFNEYMKDDIDTAIPVLITDFKNAYENNKNINNKRFEIYTWILRLTGLSLLLITFGMINTRVG